MFRKLVLVAAICLSAAVLPIALFSAGPVIAATASPVGQTYVLLIHGRTDPTKCSPGGEDYGTFDTDQCGIWNGLVPGTHGIVKYVQWDAWKTSFTNPHPHGGQYEIQRALNRYCKNDGIKYNNVCHIICHSAGCPALENVIATSRQIGDPIMILTVIAAGSAAGGSELANEFHAWPQQGGLVAPIDRYLTTRYTRHQAYDHNHMKGIPIRAIAGTKLDGLGGIVDPFPKMLIGGNSYNHACTVSLDMNIAIICADSAVSLHSSCGHRYAFAYEGCNTTLIASTFPPDFKQTYDYHTWWINDAATGGFSGTAKGPYSANSGENGIYHTYDQDHSGSKDTAVREYAACVIHANNSFLCD
jgi:hypothetical protein